MLKIDKLKRDEVRYHPLMRDTINELIEKVETLETTLENLLQWVELQQKLADER